MLRPVSRLGHSADWARDLLIDRFFKIQPTGRRPFSGQCQSSDWPYSRPTVRPFRQLYG